jgi:hypothetical protein
MAYVVAGDVIAMIEMLYTDAGRTPDDARADPAGLLLR